MRWLTCGTELAPHSIAEGEGWEESRRPFGGVFSRLSKGVIPHAWHTCNGVNAGKETNLATGVTVRELEGGISRVIGDGEEGRGEGREEKGESWRWEFTSS